MINARYGHSTVILGSKLYVMGGRQYGDDENGLLSACETLDFGSKKWNKIPPLRNPRSGGAALIYGEHIYIFGGYTGNNTRSRDI